MKKNATGPTIKAGIVGAGYVSSYHIRAAQSLGFVEVAGIADPDRRRAETLAAEFGIAEVHATLKDLARLRPDVLHILTPPALHCKLTLEALEMGCHVLVEKPMAETAEDCDRMIRAAEAAGRVLSVNHSARMDPVVLRALELVRSGAIGDVLAVHFFRNSDYPPYGGGPIPAPYRRGAYPFEDLGVHGLYLLEAFLGEVRDVAVRYRSTGRQPNLLFDEWTAEVECARGPGRMYISWNARPMQNELVINGTAGLIRLDCYLQTMRIERTLPAPKPIQRMVGTTLASLGDLYRVPLNTLKFVTGKLKPNPGIHMSVRAFYEALAAGAAPPVPAGEGRRMVYWLEKTARAADAAKVEQLAPCPSAAPPRILVTGAAGMLGGALLRRLRAQGETVRVLLRRPDPALAADPDVDVIYGDLGDPEAVERAVEGIDLVYHVGAAMSGGKASFDAGTIHGTRNVIESSLRWGVKRVVYVSSVILLDHAGHTPGSPVDESHALEPHAGLRGYYTQAKLEAEQLIKDAVRDRGLRAVILRPGQIFGRGAEKFAPAGTIAFAGRWIVVGDGSLPLPLVYVEDVVDALLAAAGHADDAGPIFHIVDSGDTVTQKDYIEACRRVLGPSLRAIYVPEWVLSAAALAAALMSRVTGLNLPLSPYRLKSSRPLGPFDCSAADRKLGWRPRIGARRGFEHALLPRAAQPETPPAGESPEERLSASTVAAEERIA